MTTYQFRLPSSSRREGEGKSSISKTSQCNPNDLYLAGSHLKGVNRSGDEPISEEISNRTHSSLDSVDAIYDTRPRHLNGTSPAKKVVDLNACALDLTNRLEEAIFAKSSTCCDPRLRWRAYLTSLEKEGIRPSSRHGSRPATAASRSGCSPPTPNYSETAPKRASRCVDVKYEPALRLPSKEAEENYQRHVGSSVMQLFKHTENVSAMERAPPPKSVTSSCAARFLTRDAQEIREKFTKNPEMTAAMNYDAPYELEVVLPRCPSRQALENLEKSRSSLDFGAMFKHRTDLTDAPDYKPRGLSGDGLENRDKHLRGNAHVFSHHSDPDPNAVPRRPHVQFDGEEIYARHSGSAMSESLKTMGASQLGLTKEEPPTPREQKPQAKSSVQEVFAYRPESDPKREAEAAAAVAAAAENENGADMRDTLYNYGKHEPEPAPNPKVRPEAEEFAERGRGTLTQMMSKMFVDGRIQTAGEVDSPPCLRVTDRARENYEAARDGVAKNLIQRYGKLPGDPPECPNVRSGAHGPYKRAQGGAMLELLNPKRAFKLKFGRRRRAHSASRPKTAL